jgi:ABC-type antimicrobial peptide transport system permease subunit
MLPYYAIFYVAMAFGILNTMSMAIADRTGEIGVLLALGMSRLRTALLLMTEALWVALTAAVTGTALGGGIVLGLGRRGIDLTRFADAMDYLGVGRVVRPSVTAGGVLAANGAMVAVTLVFCLIPAVRAARLAPVAALRRLR